MSDFIHAAMIFCMVDGVKSFSARLARLSASTYSARVTIGSPTIFPPPIKHLYGYSGIKA